MPNIPLPENLQFSDLQGVFLKVEPLEVMSIVGEDKRSELYFGTNPRLKYAQGAVGEKHAHVTLLFGIHPRASFVKDVDTVLGSWTPEDVTIDHVDFFPSSVEGEEYSVIVAKLVPSMNLLQANARLGVLDHTNGFPQYTPHVTLAYVNGRANVSAWVGALNSVYAGKTLQAVRIDYGSTT